MRHVDFDPEKLQSEEHRKWWAEWSKDAGEAIEDAIDAWEDWKKKYDKDPVTAGKFELKWKSGVWGELKEWLLKNVFQDKCAYCEIHMPRHYNDAEHHRPKGKVTYSKNSHQEIAQTQDEAGKTIPHPGYFWLAYNWKNLLPSCEFCNSGKGKQNQFPLEKSQNYVLSVTLPDSEVKKLKSPPIKSKKWPGNYYLDVEDLNGIESPLLLHPYFDQPREYIHFGPKGIETAVAGNEKALHSIKVLQLHDDKLRKARQRAQEAAFKDYLGGLSVGDDPNYDAKRHRAEQEIQKYRNGEEPLSAAACDYIDYFFGKRDGG